MVPMSDTELDQRIADLTRQKLEKQIDLRNAGDDKIMAQSAIAPVGENTAAVRSTLLEVADQKFTEAEEALQAAEDELAAAEAEADALRLAQ
jgi:hypothetical protein